MWSSFSVLPVFVFVHLLPLPSCTVFNQIKYKIKLLGVYVPEDFLSFVNVAVKEETGEGWI